MSICAMCFSSFESHTSYGLCADCWTKDRLREWDRLQAAYKDALRKEVPVRLEIREWLTILSDFNGRCAYCMLHWYQHIEMVDSHQGLVYGNVVPVCSGCREHKRASWDVAVHRVQAYLRGDLAAQQVYTPDLFLDDGEEQVTI